MQVRKVALRFRSTGAVIMLVGDPTVNPGTREIHDGTNHDTEEMVEQYASNLLSAGSIESDAEWDPDEDIPTGPDPVDMVLEVNGRPRMLVRGGVNIPSITLPRGQRARQQISVWTVGGKDGFVKF